MKSFASTPLGLGLVCLAAVAHAPIAAEASDTVSLEEIIVTARKREESLNDIPLSISATTSEDIERLGVRDIADIALLDPALNFKQGFSPGDTRITIRGLAPTRGRPNVATLVDGIDISSEAVGIGGGSLLAK
jgi:iron complex outermembrane receptor protein